MTTVTLTVNGRRASADIDPRMQLADFVRETQTLTGTHLGCEHGVCGACTVLVDGLPVRSCITYAVTCSGAAVTTVEGLDEDEIGKELRAAFSREHALQCGYCTPGMLMSARDLVLRAPSADEQAVRVAMSGNLCRCTGYVGIVRAVMSVIEARRARGIAPLPGAGRDRLGPAGSGHDGAVASAPAVAAANPEQRSTPAATSADGIANWEPQASFEQSFTIKRPLAEVWRFFEDTSKVASCLPGVSLAGDTTARNVNGKMRIKVGPISAEFHGTAEIDRDAATHSGTIHGSGRDQRSASATRGLIRYRLLPDNGATRVALNVGYRLTGPLAQFSRSDIVQDIAGRMITLFAQNVEAQLSGVRQVAPAAEFDAGRLFGSVLVGRLTAMLRRIFGMTNSPR